MLEENIVGCDSEAVQGIKKSICDLTCSSTLGNDWEPSIS